MGEGGQAEGEGEGKADMTKSNEPLCFHYASKPL